MASSKRLKVCRNGVTRIVVLTANSAVKFPYFGNGWAMGLNGLLANLQEASFTAMRDPRLCPIRFRLWGGWMNVMERARPLTDDEWASINSETFYHPTDRFMLTDLVEHKRDSFGVIDGRIVAVDYG